MEERTWDLRKGNGCKPLVTTHNSYAYQGRVEPQGNACNCDANSGAMTQFKASKGR